MFGGKVTRKKRNEKKFLDGGGKQTALQRPREKPSEKIPKRDCWNTGSTFLGRVVKRNEKREGKGKSLNG